MPHDTRFTRKGLQSKRATASPIIQTSTNTRASIFPNVQNWKSITCIDSSAMQIETSKQQNLGAGVFTPTIGTGYSDAITINPGGNSPTLTINRAELAAVLVAVQKGHSEIATDSTSSLF